MGLLLASTIFGITNETSTFINYIKGQRGEDEKVKEAMKLPYKTNEKVVVLGFAETATALGMAVVSAIENSYYVTTTRENIQGIKSFLTFEEEHSHSTTHRCFPEDPYKLKEADRIILVDDEITTGKSMLNIIKGLKRTTGVNKYEILTILDWRSLKYKKLYKDFAKKNNIEIEVKALVSGEIKGEDNKIYCDEEEKIIDEILRGKDVLAIMPTGGGKSLCYQIPALILDGITIVISPLISLMKDQVDTLNSMGIDSAFLNSSLSTYEFNEVMNGIENKKYKIIYVAPERLHSNEFITAITQVKIAQVAIDEAHCVSQWGHDFRISYKGISTFIDKLIERPIITAFTATASQEVRNDIVNLLRLNNPKIFVTGFDRENLRINVIKGIEKKKFLLVCY